MPSPNSTSYQSKQEPEDDTSEISPSSSAQQSMQDRITPLNPQPGRWLPGYSKEIGQNWKPGALFKRVRISGAMKTTDLIMAGNTTGSYHYRNLVLYGVELMVLGDELSEDEAKMLAEQKTAAFVWTLISGLPGWLKAARHSDIVISYNHNSVRCLHAFKLEMAQFDSDDQYQFLARAPAQGFDLLQHLFEKARTARRRKQETQSGTVGDALKGGQSRALPRSGVTTLLGGMEFGNSARANRGFGSVITKPSIKHKHVEDNNGAVADINPTTKRKNVEYKLDQAPDIKRRQKRKHDDCESARVPDVKAAASVKISRDAAAGNSVSSNLHGSIGQPAQPTKRSKQEPPATARKQPSNTAMTDRFAYVVEAILAWNK